VWCLILELVRQVWPMIRVVIIIVAMTHKVNDNQSERPAWRPTTRRTSNAARTGVAPNTNMLRVYSVSMTM
jgi:hypothetical protein